MENKTFIPQYLQCTCCKRTLESNSTLWSNIDKRICNCCECMAYTDITQCRRTNCKYHAHIDDDFILAEDVKVAAPATTPAGEDFNPDLCIKCQTEPVKESFYQLSGKITHINEESRSVINKIQIRFCGKCYAELVKFIRKDG